MSDTASRFPFAVDKMAAVGLVDQLVDSIRMAIERNQLGEGAALPGFREIARRLDVSLRVPRDAIRRLSREGLVCARRGVGTVVCGKSLRQRHWRVLLLHQETNGSYYLNRIFETIGMRLSQQGVTVVREIVPYLSRGEGAIDGVRGLLKRESFDCALVMLYEDEYFSLLEQFGIPYVASALRPKRYPGASGLVLNSYRTATSRFAADCIRKKVRRVLQVSTALDVLDLAEIFGDRGIAVETIRIPVKSWDENSSWAIRSTTRNLLGKRLARGDLPDVIFLFDDFVARGGLVALHERGIRFPEDVGVVVWSNRGDDVMAEKPLTSLTMDVPAWADRIADEFLLFLQTGRFVKGLVSGPTYIRGESF